MRARSSAGFLCATERPRRNARMQESPATCAAGATCLDEARMRPFSHAFP
jgi:hypothetical protein